MLCFDLFTLEQTKYTPKQKKKTRWKGKREKKPPKTRRAESLTFVSRITVHTSFS